MQIKRLDGTVLFDGDVSNLRDADLCDADLCGADLCGADLPSPTIVLLAHWGQLSDTATLALMRLDASAHPDPEAFNRWKITGECPYSHASVQRMANFSESRDLWSPGAPPTIWEAMCMVLNEKCPGWNS